MEKWKITHCHYGYSVSSRGRVRSNKRKIRFLSKKGKEFFRLKKEKILSLHNKINNAGYISVCLGKLLTKHLHQLVAESFVPGKTNIKRCVNHIDGNKLNNHYKNLEWVSYKTNNRKAWSMGLYENARTSASVRWSGDKNPQSRVSRALRKAI